MSEFELIDRIIAILGDAGTGAGVHLGTGDDAALLTVPDGCELVVTTDTLVADRHFPAAAKGDWVARRALGVNLSDLAAMGAEARHCVVALTLPAVDEAWVEAFARDLAAAAQRHGVAVVGGNLARGPLAITITALGVVPHGAALLRSGARVGDTVFVSGQIGANHAARLADSAAFYEVEPRLALGIALRGVASAAIDVSDGLLADLGHLCSASGVRGEVALEAVPVAAGVEPATALTAGDDYELLFTAARAPASTTPVTAIGRIVEGAGVAVLNEGEPWSPAHGAGGYRHFP